jgi:hypothetical protein
LKVSILVPVKSTGKYEFAAVPDDWVIDERLAITTSRVYRTRNTSYTIGIKTLNRIWKSASVYWAGISTDSEIINIKSSGYSRDGTIRENGIKIGCQDIQRYELEQLAVKLNWEFPTP